MQYKVNENERKNLIRRKIARGSRALRMELMISQVFKAVLILAFLILLAVSIGNAVCCLLKGMRGTELFTMCIFIVCTPIPILILSLIPMTIRRHAYKKYLVPWASYEQEELILHTRTFEQGYVDLFSGQSYLTNKMRYADITRMEYDEEAEILRVYGPFEVKEWSSINREHCYDTIPPDPSYNVWIDLLPYYEDFSGLMEELESRSGKRIIRKTGSCSSVGTKEDR